MNAVNGAQFVRDRLLVRAHSKEPLFTGPPSVKSARWDDETWRLQAGCIGVSTATFFPEREHPDALDVALAKTVCMSCPVSDNCLDFAIETMQNDGVWGGKTEEERSQIKRARKRRARLDATLRAG